MNEKCTHETSIVLQDCNGFSILQCTWACGLQLIELHLDNHEVKTFAAQDLARITAENIALRKVIEKAIPNLESCAHHHRDDYFIEDELMPEIRAALKQSS